MKNEHQRLYNIVQHFIGMQKIEAYDMLQQLEVLFFECSSPIVKKDIRHAVLSKIIDSSTKVVLLPNGNFCQLIAQNNWLFLYKEQRTGIYKYRFFSRYYFRLKNPLTIVSRFNKQNLLAAFANTAEEVDIRDFLQKNKRITTKKGIEKLLALRITVF